MYLWPSSGFYYYFFLSACPIVFKLCMSDSFFIAHLLRPSATKSDEDKIFRKFCRTQKSSAKKFRVKFFVELFLLMKLIRCSFSRWFRISRFRRMKMSRKKVISRARLSSTLRKFSKKYVSFRPPRMPWNFFFSIRPSYVLIVFAPP